MRRMLKDAKASALVENFGGQWLQTRALESHIPDRTKFTEFTDYTRHVDEKETELFFEYILREDRPILDFIDADYTFLNQRLAEFYGIGGIKGHEFRKVDLTGKQRGGVLTHASVLTVSSYPNRTSPVLRGKWILENILNAPPPPPPPNVPSLDENAVGKAVLCANNWRSTGPMRPVPLAMPRLDPLGFALEHFDAIGRWREETAHSPISTSGTLPDGRSFKDHAELRALLKTDAGAFTECLTEKMLTYALGRGLERPDKETVNAIAERRGPGGLSLLQLGAGHRRERAVPECRKGRVRAGAMIVTGKHLSRRSFLTRRRRRSHWSAAPGCDGAGPGVGQIGNRQPPLRLGFVYVPNGMVMANWTPAAPGTNFAFTPILKPL